jgi:hypothetical protein
MNHVKAAYEDGICPDCDNEIPDDVEEGEACAVCGHVFWSGDNDDDYDGQPDEWQEWHDFDPDC